MAGRYLDRALAAEGELVAIKKVMMRSDRLLAHSVLVEAALAVLMKHNLLDEYTVEVTRLNAIADGTAEKAT